MMTTTQLQPRLTLGDAYDLIKDKSRNHHDQLVPVKDIGDCTASSIRIYGQTHPLSTIAARALCGRLNIPFNYITALPKYMQQLNINHGLTHQREKELLVRYDGNRVRAIFSKRYVQMDHLTIIGALMEAGIDAKRPVQLRMDEGLMQLSLLQPERNFALRGDDVHTPGLSILNSELGLSSFRIAPYTLRLVCTNGLISRIHGTATNYRHVSDKALKQLPRILHTAAEQVDQQRRQLTLSLDSPVEDMETTLETMGRQFGLDKQQKEAVTWALPQETGPTLFHVVQTLTRAAHFPELDTEQTAHLQQVGGEVLRLVKPWKRAA